MEKKSTTTTTDPPKLRTPGRKEKTMEKVKIWVIQDIFLIY